MYGFRSTYLGVLSIAFEPLPFFCSIVNIAVRFLSCQLPSCDLFTSHSIFIVFWERDITSERHGTPVHISIIVFIFSLLLAFSFSCSYYYLSTFVFDPL